MTRWALWLTVASAFSRAYLRRIIGLYREEQLVGYPGRMRTVWLEHHLHDTSDWLHYLEIEQELLHNHLYAKPTDPERHITQSTLRLLSSVAYMAALILVYIYAGEGIWLDNQVNNVVTYTLLVVGFLVEVAYVIRLLFRKCAMVAMVVTLVRTQRAAQRCPSWAARKLYIMKVTICRLACVGSLRINMFMDPSYRNINRQYLPRSVALSWLQQLLEAVNLVYSVSHSQRGWDMFCMMLPEGCDHEREISAGSSMSDGRITGHI